MIIAFLSTLEGMIATDGALPVNVKFLIEGEDGELSALRLAVKRAGCAGYSYDMFFDSQIDDSDIAPAPRTGDRSRP